MTATTRLPLAWPPKSEQLLKEYRERAQAEGGSPRLVRLNATAITMRFGFAWVPAWAVRAAIAGCDEKTPNLDPNDYVDPADLGTAAQQKAENDAAARIRGTGGRRRR